MSLNGDRDAVEKLVDAALASLEANRARIDDLNVYPVPDGDTGTNLTMTMRYSHLAPSHHREAIRVLDSAYTPTPETSQPKASASVNCTLTAHSDSACL